MSCKRCGKCCIEVGRTFWKVGDYGKIPELDEIARNGDHEDNELPCEQLEMVNSKAICKIHRDYGYPAKPKVCSRYPEDGELCFREKALK